jgi:hypothetical protein
MTQISIVARSIVTFRGMATEGTLWRQFSSSRRDRRPQSIFGISKRAFTFNAFSSLCRHCRHGFFFVQETIFSNILPPENVGENGNFPRKSFEK